MRETVGDWLRLLAGRYGIQLPELEEMMGYEFEEVPPVTSRLVESMDAAFAEAHSTGFEEGRSEGIEQERSESIKRERSLLCRMAALKFGAAEVEDMPALMAGVAARRELGEVDDCLMRCDSADQLLACIRDVLRRTGK